MEADKRLKPECKGAERPVPRPCRKGGLPVSGEMGLLCPHPLLSLGGPECVIPLGCDVVILEVTTRCQHEAT